MAHALADGQPALFLAHRRELVDQARVKRGFEPETIQGLAASGRRPPADLIIVDECHTVAFTTRWRTVLSDYHDARILGLTATPQRGDGRALDDIYDRMVIAASYSELLAGGYLVGCRTVRPDVSLEGGIAQPAAETWIRLAGSRRGFIYCGSVEAARSLAVDLTGRGVPSACIDGRQHPAVRAQALSDFRAGRIRCLTNCYCLVEGVDVPQAEVCMIARGCTHMGAYLQMVGRVLRTSPGKDRALLIDLAGITHTHGLPCTDVEYSLDGQPLRPTTATVRTCISCGTAYSGPAQCPECGHSAPPKERSAPRIYSVELREVYDGAATPYKAKATEWSRLQRLAESKGWGYGWAVREYRKLFGECPTLTREQVSAERARLQRLAESKGYKPGWVWHRLKEMS